MGLLGSQHRGFQQGVFNKADRRLRLGVQVGPAAADGGHWDRENPDIAVYDLEFLFV